MARKRTGHLILTKNGFAARLPVIVGHVDGKPVREKKWFPLGTDNRSVAKRQLAALLVATGERGENPTPQQTAATETVDAYASTWLADREARKRASAANERRYYERLWKPAIASLLLDEVRAPHLRPWRQLSDMNAVNLCPPLKCGSRAF